MIERPAASRNTRPPKASPLTISWRVVAIVS